MFKGDIPILGTALYGLNCFVLIWLKKTHTFFLSTWNLAANFRGLSISSEWERPKFTRGGYRYFGKKNGGYTIFDDQNVGSHKMTTDSVLIMFKNTNFNTIPACLGGKM